MDCYEIINEGKHLKTKKNGEYVIISAPCGKTFYSPMIDYTDTVGCGRALFQLRNGELFLVSEEYLHFQQGFYSRWTLMFGKNCVIYREGEDESYRYLPLKNFIRIEETDYWMLVNDDSLIMLCKDLTKTKLGTDHISFADNKWRWTAAGFELTDTTYQDFEEEIIHDWSKDKKRILWSGNLAFFIYGDLVCISQFYDHQMRVLRRLTVKESSEIKVSFFNLWNGKLIMRCFGAGFAGNSEALFVLEKGKWQGRNYCCL